MQCGDPSNSSKSPPQRRGDAERCPLGAASSHESNEIALPCLNIGEHFFIHPLNEKENFDIFSQRLSVSVVISTFLFQESEGELQELTAELKGEGLWFRGLVLRQGCVGQDFLDSLYIQPTPG